MARMVEGPTTVQYPEEKTAVYPRFRGRHKLHKFEDTGLEKCVGCSLCAAACPADCIRVVAAENDPADRVSAGERYASVYEINLARCIFCGYCEVACPFDAITMGHDYEMADYNRGDLIFTKEMLLAEPSSAPRFGPRASSGLKHGTPRVWASVGTYGPEMAEGDSAAQNQELVRCTTQLLRRGDIDGVSRASIRTSDRVSTMSTERSSTEQSGLEVRACLLRGDRFLGDQSPRSRSQSLRGDGDRVLRGLTLGGTIRKTSSPARSGRSPLHAPRRPDHRTSAPTVRMAELPA